MSNPEFREPNSERDDREKMELGVEFFKVSEEAAEPIDKLFDQASEGVAISSSQLWDAAKAVRRIVFYRTCKAIGLNEAQMREVLGES
jgi:hypothetical protein